MAKPTKPCIKTALELLEHYCSRISHVFCERRGLKCGDCELSAAMRLLRIALRYIEEG